MSNSQNLTKREQRIKQAVRLYYGEDMTEQQISDEIGVARRTVSEYLNSEDAGRFIRPYSDKEEHQLREHLEEKRQHIEELTEEVAQEVINSDISPEKKLRAVKELREDVDSLVEFLHKTGVVVKEPDKLDVEHSGEVSVLDRAREYMNQQEQEDE